MARKSTGHYALVLLATMALAGCALVPAATDPAAAHERAQAVLAAWADAVAKAGEPAAVTPVGELTGQIGDWEEAVGGCSAVGARRTATATLAAPLGSRAVLDIQQGTPVPLVLAP